MDRGKTLIGLLGITAVELLYLRSFTYRPHTNTEFAFAVVLVFATIFLGATIVFSLPDKKSNRNDKPPPGNP